MSSDARIRFQHDGFLRGSHDGECRHRPHAVVSKYDLGLLIQEIETCLERSLAWEIQDSGMDEGVDERYYLAGWSAR